MLARVDLDADLTYDFSPEVRSYHITSSEGREGFLT